MGFTRREMIEFLDGLVELASALLRNASGKKASLKSRDRTRKICALDVRTDSRKGIVFPA